MWPGDVYIGRVRLRFMGYTQSRFRGLGSSSFDAGVLYDQAHVLAFGGEGEESYVREGCVSALVTWMYGLPPPKSLEAAIQFSGDRSPVRQPTTSTICQHECTSTYGSWQKTK